nr:hypothetical protein [Tanacetum cinerariifolium]
MEKKDTVTSNSDSEEQHKQQLQMQASSQKEMQALSKSVNETQMQMQEGKVDMGITLDAGLLLQKAVRQSQTSRIQAEDQRIIPHMLWMQISVITRDFS